MYEGILYCVYYPASSKSLPEPARTRVRGFILTLPQRWVSKASGTSVGVTGGSEHDSSVTVAASGTGATRRPGGQRRAAYRERGSGGIEGDLRSSPAPSPSSSPRISRIAVGRRGSDVGEGGEGGRVPAGTALVAAQRILALATESLDMMRNVTGVMKDSLDRAEAWVGRLRTVGIQRDTQVEDADTSEDIPSSPFFSASSTTWGSNSIPSTPGGDTFTPVYAGGAGGTASPGMTIPIEAMSLSSRYETPRSENLCLADEEEEEEDGIVKNDDEGAKNKKTEEEEEIGTTGGIEKEGLKMDVDLNE